MRLPFVDLGAAPRSNAYLTESDLRRPETWYPLRVLVCESCWLVQTDDFVDADQLFDAQYAYFSGTSSTWVAHARRYADEMIARFGLDASSRVVEIASNDGYLLQFFRASAIPCLGVEPTASTAAAARARGLEVVEAFFGTSVSQELAASGMHADLIVANNVLAHVPDVNDFATGFTCLLKPNGVATFEFPHLMRLVAENQFDTIYHEHFSYLSLTAVDRIFRANGLVVFDVEEHPTHGGSLRVFAQRADTGRRTPTHAVAAMLAREENAGVRTAAFYGGVQTKAERAKNDFLGFLLAARRDRRSVVGYGAAAKGNTLLNFAGVRPDLISHVVDNAASKQGKFLPGSRIPILSPSVLDTAPPDYIVVLPWNIADEIRSLNMPLAARGTRFVTAVPELRVE